jgi:hypothetical protein
MKGNNLRVGSASAPMSPLANDLTVCIKNDSTHPRIAAERSSY